MNRLLRAAVALANGYYGALLASLSPRLHEAHVRRRMHGPYRGTVAETLLAVTDELARSQDQEAAMQAARNAIVGGLHRGEFDQWVNANVGADGKETLVECADYLPGRSWKLQLFYIAEGHSHPPHSHSDVASCLVMAKGTVHAREYDRFRDLESDSGHAVLSLASDRLLSAGDSLITTRSANDVHWFGAVNGSAVAFNFQAVGFMRGRKALEARRVYLDATEVGSSGRHKVPFLGKKEAKSRFRQHPLSAFPVKS